MQRILTRDGLFIGSFGENSSKFKQVIVAAMTQLALLNRQPWMALLWRLSMAQFRASTWHALVQGKLTLRAMRSSHKNDSWLSKNESVFIRLNIHTFVLCCKFCAASIYERLPREHCRRSRKFSTHKLRVATT